MEGRQLWRSFPWQFLWRESHQLAGDPQPILTPSLAQVRQKSTAKALLSLQSLIYRGSPSESRLPNRIPAWGMAYSDPVNDISDSSLPLGSGDTPCWLPSLVLNILLESKGLFFCITDITALRCLSLMIVNLAVSQNHHPAFELIMEQNRKLILHNLLLANKSLM